jgi:hypothetical protein
MLVRLAVTQDNDYEVSQQFLLQARNAGVSVVTGVGTIVDEGNGEVFLVDNSSGVPNARGEVGFPVNLDDDRPKPEAPLKPSAVSPAAAPILPPRQQVLGTAAAQVHVQNTVAATRQADLQQVAAVSSAAGLGGVADQIRLSYVDAVETRFAQSSDPYLYVLPAVSEVGGERRDAAIATVLLQTGLLMNVFPLNDRGVQDAGLLSRAERETSSAQQQQADLVTGPEAVDSGELSEVVAAARQADEQALEAERQQWARLARLFDVMPQPQPSDTRVGNATADAAQGWRFGQLLKRAALARGGTAMPLAADLPQSRNG